MFSLILKSEAHNVIITRIRYGVATRYRYNGDKKTKIGTTPWITYIVIEIDHLNKRSIRHISIPAERGQLMRTMNFFKSQYGGKIIKRYGRKSEGILSLINNDIYAYNSKKVTYNDFEKWLKKLKIVK